MKRVMVAFALMVALSALAQTDKTHKKPSEVASGSVEQQLVKAEKEWADALVKGDEATVARLEADDITTVQDDGSVTTKKDDLTNLKSGDTKFTSLEESDVHVREYGNTAVVTGSYHAKGTNKGKAFDENGRFTDTWVKRNGRWQAVASQDTLIAK